MPKKPLSILIPYYKESTKEIFPLLASINNQVGINFDDIECILVNDGANNKFQPDFLQLFDKLNIKCVFMDENKGPGVARQTGLDCAIGEYVMFCDADDVLHNVGVLGAFLQEIEQSRADIIVSQWLEELYDQNAKTYCYITHENEITWMHGKAFRRNYLQANNIKFHDDLRIHEDSYFLAIAHALTENIKMIPAITYVWKYVETSITRRNGASYTYDSMPEFNRAVSLSWEVLKKSAPEIMPYKVIQFIVYNYFVLNRADWRSPEVSEYLRKAEKSLAETIQPYMRYFENAPLDLLYKVYNEERSKLFHNCIEEEHLGVWLERIKRQSRAEN